MALTKVQTIGIETGVSLTGVTTVTTLNASTDTLSVGGTVNFGGNVSIAGTLTYEDVTNIDSVGIITARSDISIADKIIHTGDTNTAIRFPAADTFTVETAGSERVRITSAGDMGLGVTDPTILDDSGFRELVVGGATEGGAIHLQDADGNVKFGAFTSDASNAAFIRTITNHPIVFRTNNTERLRIDSSGRLLVGTDTNSKNITDDDKQSIVLEGNAVNGGLTVTTYNGTSFSDTTGPRFNLQRSRGTSDGTMTVVTSSDLLGKVEFRGADGTNFISAATISAFSDGTPGSNDMPGRLVFATTADGASSPTERMRIKSDGTLHVIKSGTQITNAEQSVAVFQRSSAAGSSSRVSLVSGNAAASHINFGDTDDEDIGQLNYYHTDNSMRFLTNTSERMRIWDWELLILVLILQLVMMQQYLRFVKLLVETYHQVMIEKVLY